MSPRRPPAPSSDPGRRPAAGGGAGGRARPAAVAAGAPGRVRAARPGSPAARSGSPPARPPSSRPRPGSAGRTDSARAGTGAGTGRPLWVLGAVGVVLAMLILPFFQKWLVQRSEIARARSAVAQGQREVAALDEQRARWADDEYVKAQARRRLYYVMPGETGFVVVDPKPARGDSGRPVPPDPTIGTLERPWFTDIWLSAQVAGEPRQNSSR